MQVGGRMYNMWRNQQWSALAHLAPLEYGKRNYLMIKSLTQHEGTNDGVCFTFAKRNRVEDYLKINKYEK